MVAVAFTNCLIYLPFFQMEPKNGRYDDESGVNWHDAIEDHLQRLVCVRPIC